MGLSSIQFRLSQLEMGGARIGIQALGGTSRAKFLIITLYWHHLSWLKCAIHSMPFLCLCINTFSAYFYILCHENLSLWLYRDAHCYLGPLHNIPLYGFNILMVYLWIFFCWTLGLFPFLLFTHKGKSLWVFIFVYLSNYFLVINA